MSALIFLLMALCAANVYAETEKPGWAPDVSGGVTFETKYIWRGQNIVDDPVVQPEVSIGKYGLTFSYWGNISTASSQRRWTEHDYGLDYTFNIGQAKELLGIGKAQRPRLLDRLGFSLGHIFYVFPEYSGKDFNSEEFYFGASYDCFLRPSFKWYVDYARGAGSYLQFAIGHAFDLQNGMSLKVNTTLAYNAGQWGYGYKFAPLLLSAEFSVPLFRYFTLTPNINYSVALDRGSEEGLAYGSEFYGGVKVSAAF